MKILPYELNELNEPFWGCNRQAVYRIWNTRFDDSVVNKIKFDHEHEIQIVDMDGTFTGNEELGAENPTQYMMVRDTDIVDKGLCYFADQVENSDVHPGIVCPYPEMKLISIRLYFIEISDGWGLQYNW